MSTAVSQTPAMEALPPLSEGQRMVNTFIAPSKTFIDIRRNASWWKPWLLISAVSLVFIMVIGRQIGFESIARTEITRSSRAEQFEKMAPADQAKQLQISVLITKVFSYGVPFTILLMYVIIASVLMGTFNVVAGAGISFGRSLAITVYSGLPGLIGALLGIVALFAGVDRDGFNVRNPVATNPAYFMDPTANRFLYGMLSALDVFVIWSIILMAMGFSLNSKAKRSTAIMIVAGWYLGYKLISSALGAAFS